MLGKHDKQTEHQRETVERAGWRVHSPAATTQLIISIVLHTRKCCTVFGARDIKPPAHMDEHVKELIR